ncbi:MAG TPA: Ppx/GppA phosphatase family protein [Candidatus Didemnitutus sp.]|nr:Ppx/GppA phosphatase family protein [Candidatus Didemnitutus sp.]
MDEQTSAPSLIASIDVGTNSFHMVIASVSTRGVLRIHARNKEMVRLGSSAGDMKRLAPEAMDRGVATLKRFAAEALQHGAHIRAVATSAVREALNKDEFVRRVIDATGVEIEVIPGIEEGRLIYLGALHALPILAKRTFVIDIGGGSTETVIGYQGEAAFVDSAKLGHIRMTKRFFPDPTITDAQIEACRKAIRGEWAAVFQSLIAYGFEHAVGCSGTVMAIAAMSIARTNKRLPESMNAMRIERKDILDVVESIVHARTQDARLALPGMDPKRADVITGGALILEQAIIGLNIQELTISGYALREGIVFDTVQKQRDIDEYHHLSHLRYQSVDHLCDLYRVRRRHAEHVKNLCLRLFDDLHALHKYGDRERELLEAAALLHDVGYHIAADQHHKHSEYIIRNSAMPGFTNDEAEIIANIARYHRKSHPKKKHPSFAALSADEQRLVRVLSAILRIGEGLDRRQQQVVQTIRVNISAGMLDVYLVAPTGVPDIELWGAERRKELLEETFGRKVRLLVHAH